MNARELACAYDAGQGGQIALSVPLGHAQSIRQVLAHKLNQETLLVHAGILLAQVVEDLMSGGKRWQIRVHIVDV